MNKWHDPNPLINSVQTVHTKRYIVWSKPNKKTDNCHISTICDERHFMLVAGFVK